MFRRFAPTLLFLACFLLDTTIIPIVYTGVYAVPLTMVAVCLIGMLMGRMRGLLYGTIGGLLIDITSGTLGLMAFYCMAVGFMIGLIRYVPGESLRPARRNAARRRFQRAMWVFVLFAAGEIAILTIQYFNTATLHWIYFLNIAVRSAICAALVTLFRPLAYRLLMGGKRRRAPSRSREVKSF